METTMTRRTFLGGAAALSVAAGTDVTGAAAESRGSFKLPARGEFVIRSAYVMTMDAALGDIPRGTVHVKNGAIVAVGADVKASGAVEVIDGRDMIVLPGFVDTHWHMWNTLLRSMAGDKREHGYFPTVATLGKVFTPDDMFQGTRLSAVEALYSGFTFVHDWCHNIRGPSSLPPTCAR
jgi:5-methylthioadenosine/S-adenosylhomocysteine deaminase